MPQNPLIKFEYVVKNLSTELSEGDGSATVINYDNHSQFETGQQNVLYQPTTSHQPTQIEIWQHGPR